MSGIDRSALVRLLIEQDVLRFGEFTLKSGRQSPYFFNLGSISTGSALTTLGLAYAECVASLDVPFDTVFGPAYKGIPIAVATAQALAGRGQDCGWAFNRKEAKGHGEGGRFVGAPPTGRLLLVDDVLTAGTAIREAAGQILEAGGTLVGVVIALDRQERLDPEEPGTAVTHLEKDLGVPVRSLLSLQDVIQYLDLQGGRDNHQTRIISAVKAYQAQYCEQRTAPLRGA